MSWIRRILVVCCAAGLCVHATGQGRTVQYKRIGLDAMAQFDYGRIDAGVEVLQDYLADHPDDAESLYGMAVAHTQRGEIDAAMAYVRRALDAGLPFGRFVAGPRSLLGPLYESARFKALAAEHDVTLVHGPMLGADGEATLVWLRTASEVPVLAEVSASEDFENVIRSNRVLTEAVSDYTAVLRVEGLEPGTEYHYRLVLNGDTHPNTWQFRTSPEGGKPAQFSVVFGGGAGYTPQFERMWTTIRDAGPDALLMLGDNVYIDHPEMPAIQRYCYYRRQSRPEWRGLVARQPVFAIYDDHDFTINDGWGGPLVNKPEWKIPVWELFKENWANPAYGGGATQPGCWFRFSIADVDFFMLDGRYYRTNPTEERKSMLGPAQKRWLFEQLGQADGTFKVLASPVPWSEGTKPGSLDTWDGYPEEREQIFSFIDENDIEGVILIAADRHRSDFWKTERPGGYPFYEFQSSRLTNIHTHKVMEQSIFGYNEKCSFGRLRFDTTAADPTVTYYIINIDGEDIYSYTVKKSELRFGDE